MDWKQFIEWAFMGTLSSGVIWCAKYLGEVSGSVNELNQKIAVVLEKMSWHEKELNSHDVRITSIESKIKRR